MELYSFDDDYVRRLREGDRWTLEHFVRYFEEMMLLKLRHRVRTFAELEDVRQEVFRRVFHKLRQAEGLREGAKLGSFVNSVCNNVRMEMLRSGGRTDELPVDADQISDTSESVEQALVNAEKRAQVRRTLDELDPRDAKLLRVIFLEERDKDEVCREFHVDREYLRVLLFRAKEKFRAAYNAEREVLSFSARDTEGGEPSLRH